MRTRPDALAKALRALREHCRGTLWCVFGCGGDRDPGKRPLMGAVADELADQIIVTDDNPRSENPQAITRAHHRRHQRRTPRGSSTIAARPLPPRSAKRGAADVVLIAGKGHEDYQIYGADARAASAIGAKRSAISGRRHEADLASDAARVLGGELIGWRRRGPALRRGVDATAARSSPGALFVALRGPNFDGAEFVAAAAARGAVGAMVERPVPAPLPQIVVAGCACARCSSSRRPGARIIRCPSWRSAGSNGKTTAKEMTAAILSRMGPCLATHGNLNNHIGVPLTLMRLEASHRSAVIEMGANRIGDVAELVTLARPTVGSHHQCRRGTSGGIRRSRRRRQGRG